MPQKTEPQDFPNEKWREVAQAIKDGHGCDALLIFCEEFGNAGTNYKMVVPSAKTIRSNAGSRIVFPMEQSTTR